MPQHLGGSDKGNLYTEEGFVVVKDETFFSSSKLPPCPHCVYNGLLQENSRRAHHSWTCPVALITFNEPDYEDKVRLCLLCISASVKTILENQ
jgi:hypothetical protein